MILCFQVGSVGSAAAPLLFPLLSPPRSVLINMASGDDDDPIIEEVCHKPKFKEKGVLALIDDEVILLPLPM